jgi:hypothetical protein
MSDGYGNLVRGCSDRSVIAFVVGSDSHLHDKYWDGHQWIWEIRAPFHDSKLFLNRDRLSELHHSRSGVASSSALLPTAKRDHIRNVIT